MFGYNKRANAGWTRQAALESGLMSSLTRSILVAGLAIVMWGFYLFRDPRSAEPYFVITCVLVSAMALLSASEGPPSLLSRPAPTFG